MSRQDNGASRDSSRKIREMKKYEMKHVRRRWHIGTFGHFVTVFFTLILSVVLLVGMVCYQFFYGPSPAVRVKLTKSLMESSALKFVPYWFMGENTDAIIRDVGEENTQQTDTSLVTVKAHTFSPEDEESQEEFDENGVRIERVNGPTFYGTMMIVQDPARVSVATSSPNLSSNQPGKMMNELIEMNNALGGINGGAFRDVNGSGNGGQAHGLVYSNGKRINRAEAGQYATVVGFDRDNILRVGQYTNDDAERIGLRDAVAFGPALIVNGKPSVFTSSSSGLNPRSAIGQRADGAVLMLVIDGRQANSLGASYEDLVDVMLRYGAVNACNLDGGSSSIMYYKGEKLNDGMTISVSRKMPTGWIVK